MNEKIATPPKQKAKVAEIRALPMPPQGFKTSKRWETIDADCGVLHRSGFCIPESGARHV